MKEPNILRAKTLDLRQTRPLTQKRQKNSQQNETEALNGVLRLETVPRRFVFELTNACNLNCMMCGRNAANFQPTWFQTEWLSFFEPIADRVEEVTLMGWGEPTVHPCFSKFLDWAHHLGLRKYFCTNGMRLDSLFDDIFRTETDIIAVSMDGACMETNEKIRRGADFHKILKNISAITEYKAAHFLEFPYMNFVFTAMDQNLEELPELVRLAGELGLNEVKVVYLTAFDQLLASEVLYHKMSQTQEVFQAALEMGQKHSVSLKLPYLAGEDPAGEQCHKTCYTAWRDFFLGSDGFVRPCMSTAEKLFAISRYDDFWEMWNSEEYRQHRERVNEERMAVSCQNCYQSSYANWNKQTSFLQLGKQFSPEWKEK